MICCTVFRTATGYRGFEVTGHAGMARKGKDVLCAAVSILTTHTAMTIQEELGKKGTGKQTAGYFRFEITDTDETTDMLFRAFLKRMIGLSEEYPRKIKVEVKT
ncbi:MAG TPA: ribosomal-processing cysteine protease Prp [Thermotogota bacterium]|nr:ribosomal-processing cysteine protease Prp [Thermotogota bacterium]NLH18863.1 ribosomal-processing cysteine protease Prp [Thermotogaceae bacterium]OQC29943.1 MAG: hypothetical protein BWX67_02045 [Thermotogota bacterium ADurb.Bin062]HNW46681.1 ribosomal-processing cysteine protease Prp [Thermotogota bacterium]HNY81240.1 ribosomal-processing cysteine protease Prp [Thermotogota bacterium]